MKCLDRPNQELPWAHWMCGHLKYWGFSSLSSNCSAIYFVYCLQGSLAFLVLQLYHSNLFIHLHITFSSVCGQFSLCLLLIKKCAILVQWDDMPSLTVDIQHFRRQWTLKEQTTKAFTATTKIRECLEPPGYIYLLPRYTEYNSIVELLPLLKNQKDSKCS